MDYNEYTRKQLYDFLTVKSLTRLAKDENLMYQDLRDVCITNEIPYRTSEDWYHLSLGEEVNRIPLDGDPEKIVKIRKVGKNEYEKKENKYVNEDKSMKKKSYTCWTKEQKYIPPKQKTTITAKSNEVKSSTPGNDRTVFTKTIDEEKTNMELAAEELKRRIAAYPEKATLYQILNLSPNEFLYKSVDIRKIVRTVRAQNVLSRSRIFNLHAVLSLTYEEFAALRNNGIMSMYQILKDITEYAENHRLVKENNSEQIELIQNKEKSEDQKEPAGKDLMVDLLVAFNQLNMKGKEALVDIAQAFGSVDKYAASNLTGNYKVITLCGSTMFKEAFIEAQKRLTLEGNIVLSVGLFGHSGDEEVWDEGKKEMLDDMHKRKIDMADEIFVINVASCMM